MQVVTSAVWPNGQVPAKMKRKMISEPIHNRTHLFPKRIYLRAPDATIVVLGKASSERYQTNEAGSDVFARGVH